MLNTCAGQFPDCNNEEKDKMTTRSRCTHHIHIYFQTCQFYILVIRFTNGCYAGLFTILTEVFQ